MTKKRKVRIGRLTTVMEISVELGRIYRAARRNDIESSYANRLANILVAMRQTMETAQLEKRLDDIEAKIAGKEPTPFKPRLVS
jgi:hypothetical protein